MEVGQGPNWGCSAKRKKYISKNLPGMIRNAKICTGLDTGRQFSACSAHLSETHVKRNEFTFRKCRFQRIMKKEVT
jgi:hypothetical protein